jgi:hypothetical protein
MILAQYFSLELFTEGLYELYLTSWLCRLNKQRSFYRIILDCVTNELKSSEITGIPTIFTRKLSVKWLAKDWVTEGRTLLRPWCFSSTAHSERFWDPLGLTMGSGNSFLRVKDAGAQIWPLTSILCRDRNAWSFTSTHHSVHDIVLSKHREGFQSAAVHMGFMVERMTTSHICIIFHSVRERTARLL